MTSEFGGAEFIFNLLTGLGVKNGLILEAGAFYPDQISNSSIFLNHGWQAKLVECKPEAAEAWRLKNFSNAEIFEYEIQLVPPGLIDAINHVQLQDELDVLFFDIDGGEYHLLKTLLESGRLRPKFIHVEYDNAFPLFVNYIPPEIKSGRQASATAFLYLMRSLGYVYIGTFGHDMVFSDHSFVVANKLEYPSREAFIANSLIGSYSINNAIAYQENCNAHKGVNFLASKLDVLLEAENASTAAYYSFLCYGMMSACQYTSVVKSNDSDYCQRVGLAINAFISKYAFLAV